MKDKDWQSLIWSLKQQKCVLLLGSELSRAPDDCQSLAGALCRRLSDALSSPVKLPLLLPQIAHQFAKEHGPDALESEVVDFYREHEVVASDIHAALAKLPFYFVMTSCHDKELFHAFKRAGKTPQLTRYNFRGRNDDYIPMGTIPAPLIYHLYGSIDQPESLVLTENDLLDFLVAVISKTPALPNNIRTELQKKGKSFLFLGFGITHWYLRILLHVLKFNQSNRSFALEPTADRDPAELEQTILFHKAGGYQIEVFNADIYAFVDELCSRFDASGGIAAMPVEMANASLIRPKVFISYASEDKGAASMIYDLLLGGGLDPWMDKAGLEVGAVWNQAIEARLAEADYVIVLQSQALARKSFSYVNKEIHMAMERQRYARAGIRYLIPIQIGDAPLLEELKEFQSVPILNEEDITRLISTIRRDYQLRDRQ